MSSHTDAHRRRDEYLHRRYRHYKKLDIGAQTELCPNLSSLLPANNMRARLRFARVAGEHLEQSAASLPADVPVFFVTLCRQEHVMPLEEAVGFNVAKVVGWVHEAFRGAHYVGMVEGGFFSNLGDLLGCGARCISWHAHFILWGMSGEKMGALCDKLNDRYEAVGGLCAAHFRPLCVRQVFGRGIYMCKGQVRDYRIWPCFRTGVDLSTGEILKVPTGKHRVKKRTIRAGDGVRVCEVFANRHIDDFAFAAGDGKTVLRNIKEQALSEFRRLQKTQPRRIDAEVQRALAAIHQSRG